MPKKENKIGIVSEGQIDVWKKKYGEVFELEVKGHYGYVKKPGRKDLSYATVSAGVGNSIDAIKFAELILQTCWLGGSDAIKDDDELFLSVVPTLEELTKRAEASIKKL